MSAPPQDRPDLRDRPIAAGELDQAVEIAGDVLGVGEEGVPVLAAALVIARAIVAGAEQAAPADTEGRIGRLLGHLDRLQDRTSERVDALDRSHGEIRAELRTLADLGHQLSENGAQLTQATHDGLALLGVRIEELEARAASLEGRLASMAGRAQG